MTVALSHQTPPCFFSTSQTAGASKAAKYVDEKIENGRAHLRNSMSFGRGIDEATEELGSVAEQCTTAGWDGYEAIPIEHETIRQANYFLRRLPMWIPSPTVSAEPDGHITFEWYRAPRRVLSVSIGEEGNLHYASLLGTRKYYGTEPFFGVVPLEILRLIRSIFQHDS